MIYSRFGEECKITRVAKLADVSKLDNRKPDKQDRDALKNGSYVVVQFSDGKERLYHQAFLRADRGSLEITEAIAAVSQ